MRLNEPGVIGNTEIRNRIVMAPMISNLANPDGSPNESHAAYLERRAMGGAGLIISEYTYVNDRNARGSLNELGFYDRTVIPKLRRLTERIHGHGSKIFAQLVHSGGKALKINPEVPVAPSSIDYPGRIPAELSVNEIKKIVEDFVFAARIARDGNFDGVEIHGAHGYLVQEFISPSLNRRNDAYGGTFEKRMKFAEEIIEALRSEVDITLGIRLSLYEDDPDGYGPDYGLKVAESLEGIDYVHFSAGRFGPPGSSASFYEPATHIAMRLPRKPDVKTIVVGSVRNSKDAMEVLQKSDFVAVGRGFLADPYFAWKIAESNEPLRPCIRCNQACRDLALGEVRCTVNPETGFESDRIIYEQLQGDIAIAGAGVKGIEAAIAAAKRGLKVTLFEERESIGGQLLDILDEFKKREFNSLLEYYSRILQKLGVEVITGQKYSGRAIYCLPDRTYARIVPKDSLTVDSNIYQHHDEVLGLAGNSEITISSRSLSSLDRVRRAGFERMASELGITISEDPGLRFDVSIHEKSQYDIRSAIASGRRAIEQFIQQNRNLFL